MYIGSSASGYSTLQVTPLYVNYKAIVALTLFKGRYIFMHATAAYICIRVSMPTVSREVSCAACQ